VNRYPGSATLTPEVKDVLGRSSAASYDAMTSGVRALAALNRVAVLRGTPLFAGIPYEEKARRRAAGKVAKATRKANRP